MYTNFDFNKCIKIYSYICHNNRFLIDLTMFITEPSSAVPTQKSPEELLIEQADELYSRDETLNLYLLLVPYKVGHFELL